MADITLSCPGCGKQVTVSEYVDAATPCPQCGRPLDKNAARAGSAEHGQPDKPHLASMLGRDSLVDADRVAVAEPAFDTTARPPATRRKRGRDYSEFQLWLHYIFSWLCFLVLLGGFLYWQREGQHDAQIMNSYKAARWWLAAGAWLAVVIPAFQESWVQGLLNLLIPPYTLYYALNRLDHFYLRAFYIAVVLMLAAEFYFLPGHTVLHIAQDNIAQWTSGIRDQIRHAGHRLTY
jgi:endogenous inhibitor of DNA gyrase (YacG/DUF329 family)